MTGDHGDCSGVPDHEDLCLPWPSYLAGPMSGYPDWNFPAFHAAAARLRALGWEVENPAEADERDTKKPGERPWRWYLQRDLPLLLGCKSVVVLPGWRRSRGAQLEVYVAQALGMPVLDADTLLPISESVCEEADRLVSGDRQAAYGHPLDDMDRTGRIWGAILGIADIPAEKVALCMIGVKLSREVNSPKRDNMTDAAGYAKCVDLIHAERKRRDA